MITTILACYGSFIATVGLILSVLNYRRDRAIVAVTVQTNMGTTATQGTQVIFRASNTGRRPVVLCSPITVKYRGNDDSLMVFGVWRNSFTISEGQSAAMVIAQTEIDVERADSVIVTDEAGRKWKGKFPSQPA
ncbi:hypothetical protein [Lacipirellula sp.]|uniref:hypothetical protein n=1 Tax=Lacipirellula sp. TaxID=2691419 RepID=UPI003D0DBB18